MTGSGGRRVFVSHASELRDYPVGRSYVAAVERAISACGHVIVDMADFPAADQPPAQLCADRVRSCDVYVGILGTRWGTLVRDRPEVSGTELEFDTATEAGLDRLVFLLDVDAAAVGIPLSALIDRECGSRQEAFRRRVQDSGLTTRKFADPETLGQLVERSLRELTERDRRGGAKDNSIIHGGQGVQIGNRNVQYNTFAAPPVPPARVAVVPQTRPIGDLTALALDVHRAIDVGGERDLDALPSYISRDHDRELRQIVRDAANGQSRLAFLVGESSTGKTRACWEAIRAGLPGDWQFCHPDPTRLDEAIGALDGIRPRTVIWLNDAHDYVIDPDRDKRERMAETLRRLVDEPDRKPVLVLGTTWPDRWRLAMSMPGQDQRQRDGQDPYRRVRALLDGATIQVPTTFDDGAWARLRDEADADPQLAQAYVRARDRRITQFLAGVPVLLDRVRYAPDGARALINAAMDARNLGHGRWLPIGLLEASAPGYLTDDERQRLHRDTWLAEALAYASEWCHGIRGALTEELGNSLQPTGRYRLADYLDQTARTTRKISEAPAALWEALGRHAAASDLASLAEQAEQAGFLRNAIDLYSAAAERGSTAGLLRLTWLLDRVGRTAEALRTCRRAAEVDDSGGETLADLLEKTGDREEAITAYQRAAKLGSIYALGRLTCLLRSENRIDEAIAWFQGFIRESHDDHAIEDASSILAELLIAAGRDDEAIQFHARAAEGNIGSPGSLEAGAMALKRVGRAHELLDYYKRIAESGNKEAICRATRLFEEQDRAEEAIDWLDSISCDIWDVFARDAVDGEAARLLKKTRGADAAFGWLAARRYPRSAIRFLQQAGRHEEALTWYRAYAAKTGHTDPYTLVDCLEQAGHLDEAIPVYQSLADTDPYYGIHHSTRVFLHMGRSEEAIAWLKRQGASEDRGRALCAVAEGLGRAGQVDEALEYYQRASAAGDYFALDGAARLLRETGKVDLAMTWLRARADEGHRQALDAAIGILCDVGRDAEAEQLRQSGWK